MVVTVHTILSRRNQSSQGKPYHCGGCADVLQVLEDETFSPYLCVSALQRKARTALSVVCVNDYSLAYATVTRVKYHCAHSW